MKKWIACFACLLSLLSSAQKNSDSLAVRKLDSLLSAAIAAFREAPYDLRTDSLAPQFKQMLLQELKNPLTINHSLDSLATHMRIENSNDGRVKFYSWDDWTGGTWHVIHCLAQFRDASGNIVVQELSTGREMELSTYTDCSIYEVHDLLINGEKHYLTFAWGTHGSGQEHRMIRVFKIENDSLVNCKNCFSTGSDLALEYPRALKIELKFDPKTKQITYKEFKMTEENAPFAELTGKTITLELKNGKFELK